MMTVNVFSSVNPGDEIRATALHSVKCSNLLIDGYCVVMRDESHRLSYLKMFQDENGVEWASVPLHIRSAFWVDGKPILPTEAIKLRKISKIYTANVRRNVAFPNKMKSLPRSPQAFKEYYGVRFVYVCIRDVLEDMVSSHFFIGRSRATYIHYTVCKMMITHDGMFPFLEGYEKTLHRRLPFVSRTSITRAFTYLLKSASFLWFWTLTHSSMATPSPPISTQIFFIHTPGTS